MKNIYFVATHKQAILKGDKNYYKLIHVGSSTSTADIPNSIKDNEFEDNISNKNNVYCELTGLYHIWKNVKNADIVGLCHYRRYLAKNVIFNHSILSNYDIVSDLEKYDILLPIKFKKNGNLNSLYDKIEDLYNDRSYQLIMQAVLKLCPDYEKDVTEIFTSKKMCFGNIMYCKKELFDKYCMWLFEILFFIEDDLKRKNECILPREMGYLSEWLLNVWVKHNLLSVKYYPVLFTETPFYKRMINQLKLMF